MKLELIRFYYSPHDEPEQRYHINNKRALEQLGRLKQKGAEVEIFDVNEIEDLFPHYHRATVGPSVALRPVFGTKGALEEDFGRSVPALVCYESKDDLYPTEVFPRMDKNLDRMLGINEVLDNLLTYGDTVAPAIEAPIPDEVELEPPAEVVTIEEPEETFVPIIDQAPPEPAPEPEAAVEKEAPEDVKPSREEIGEDEVLEPSAEQFVAATPTPEAPAVEEEVIVPSEPRFAQPPPPTAEPQRNGCLGAVIEWLVLLFLGTVLATAVTLGILYAFNGTLDFSRVRGVREAQSAIGQLQGKQVELEANAKALQLEADRLSQTLATLEEKANTLEDYTGTIRNDLEVAKRDIETTSKDLETLRSDVKAVATESAHFDTFLTRLRDVLIEIQGTPVPTVTPTPTNTRTPTATPTRTSTPTPTVTQTSTRVPPTSTPRRTPTRKPSATPTTESTPSATPATESTPTARPTATPTTGATPTP